jgi:ABC-type transport system involved in cytochrome bd biosynthesis fused ATPase/permease subunit
LILVFLDCLSSRNQAFIFLFLFLRFAPGLVMLCGAVGSGKTTALLGMLGQMERTAGETAVAGTIAVAGQTPFILNATLRDNILFGLPLHELKVGLVLVFISRFCFPS